MKIVHLCLGNPFLEGYGYQENLLTKYHVRLGHEVTVIASLETFDSVGKKKLLPISSCLVPVWNEDGCKIIRLKYKKNCRINRVLRRFVGLVQALNQECPDIVFIHNCQFLDIIKVVGYLKSNSKVKVFVDNHADYINSATKWYSKYILHGVLWRFCAQAISPYAVRFYGTLPNRCSFLHEMYHIPEDKIQYLEMGVDNDLIDHLHDTDVRDNIRSELSIAADDFVIVSGGKIDKRKNIHLLMKAIAEINNPNIKLIVFGNLADDVREEIERLSNHPSIYYVGWQKVNEIYKYILSSDLAIMPGTHSVIWEQIIGCGIPVVFKHFDGMHHVDVGGNCSFLYECDVNEIKNIVLHLYTNANIYQEMKKNAQTRGKDKFSYSVIAQKSITI